MRICISICSTFQLICILTRLERARARAHFNLFNTNERGAVGLRTLWICNYVNICRHMQTYFYAVYACTHLKSIWRRRSVDKHKFVLQMKTAALPSALTHCKKLKSPTRSKRLWRPHTAIALLRSLAICHWVQKFVERRAVGYCWCDALWCGRALAKSVEEVVDFEVGSHTQLSAPTVELNAIKWSTAGAKAKTSKRSEVKRMSVWALDAAHSCLPCWSTLCEPALALPLSLTMALAL